ncbi:MAG: hypothetical protein HY210_08160 [Candidatus Omnitrophica bacterium]|nr:hypothetical protein [Candidatus Omnitrophota bacterium]MBI5024477.1 hypothetical protein [Candidatus Omnitrophota bacterium]
MTPSRLLGSNQDFIVGLLRSQVRELSRLLTTIEETNTVDEHVQSCLKRVEVNIRGLRKLCSDN